MTRRNRSDSNTTQGDMMRGGLPEPPAHVHLPESARPFWRSVVSAKAADAWTPADLELAAELARTKADLERLRREVAEEGDIVDGRVSERRRLEETLSRRSIALSRTLQVHALATQGRSADQAKRNAASRDAREAASAIEGGLIAPAVPGGAGDEERRRACRPAR